ncbi:MAG: hypothetical protein ACK2UM_07535 [Anaerolineales bacterium]|jgi:hypothetical protein
MKFRRKQPYWIITSLVLGVALVLISVSASGAQNPSESDLAASTEVYLPLMVNTYPWIAPIGAQVVDFNDPNVTALAKDGGVQWARMDVFRWGKIEPQNTNSSGYKWSAVDESSLIAAHENGINVIGIIRDTPSWAQQIPPYSCGPISQTAMPEFANFVRDLVKRYSKPPFNVKYWEIWNEPDVVYSPELGFDSVFGCWGNADPGQSREFYGGIYFGEMLNVIYPVIKSVDPDAEVGIGGLLLDCDPTIDKNCLSGLFFEGILRSGKPFRGDNFDFVSYHGYTPYAGPSKSLSLDEGNPKWSHRGGVVLGKLAFIREVMGKYGIDKPVFHTEGALICPEYLPAECDPPGSDFEEAQADYVPWLFVRNWANDVDVTIWYQLQGPGWRYGGLLDEVQDPKPAYNALKFLSQELHSTTYSGRVLEGSGVAGYEFKKNDLRIWVLWSPDEVNHTVTLPSSAKKAFNLYGAPRTFSGNQITVNRPVYIELSP